VKVRSREDGSVITEKSFRLRHRRFSLPVKLDKNTLNGLGYDPVVDGTRPTTSNPFEFIREVAPAFIDGEWVSQWEIVKVNKPQDIEETYASSARSERNALLAETDWAVLPDAVTPSGYLEYRQALRDITKQPEFPFNVEWPDKPTP
jgi:hypothetical protein